MQEATKHYIIWKQNNRSYKALVKYRSQCKAGLLRGIHAFGISLNKSKPSLLPHLLCGTKPGCCRTSNECKKKSLDRTSSLKREEDQSCLWYPFRAAKRSFVWPSLSKFLECHDLGSLTDIIIGCDLLAIRAVCDYLQPLCPRWLCELKCDLKLICLNRMKLLHCFSLRRCEEHLASFHRALKLERQRMAWLWRTLARQYLTLTDGFWWMGVLPPCVSSVQPTGGVVCMAVHHTSLLFLELLWQCAGKQTHCGVLFYYCYSSPRLSHQSVAWCVLAGHIVISLWCKATHSSYSHTACIFLLLCCRGAVDSPQRLINKRD